MSSLLYQKQDNLHGFSENFMHYNVPYTTLFATFRCFYDKLFGKSALCDTFFDLEYNIHGLVFSIS